MTKEQLEFFVSAKHEKRRFYCLIFTKKSGELSHLFKINCVHEYNIKSAYMCEIRQWV
jgi:hypothetical protein